MTSTRPFRPHGRAAALALAAGLTATLLTGCGGSDSGDSTSGKDGVASLQSPGVSTDSASPTAGSAKKYKAGSKEAAQAFDEWKAQYKSCVAKKAQQNGIEVKEGTGKDEGDLVPKNIGEIGVGQGSDGKPTYPSELAKKWFEGVVTPCRKELPYPETDDDSNAAAQLAEARKKYECLRKEGLDSLHEPTVDTPQLFTPEGTSKYMGQNVDPKAKQTLIKCKVING
ncbi:hypothetical protein ACWEQ8_07405 [Streptomyces noursei]